VALIDELSGAIQAAMKAREQPTLDALRMLKTALTMRGVEKGRPLDAAESVHVVNALVKQRRDAIEQFTKAGRQELAAKEAAEITVLERYLPAAASPAEIDAAVDAAIAETQAGSLKDLGRVMKAALGRLAGKNADGKLVNELARRKLS
jgi:uncharacterized protein YqeY